MQSSDRPDFAHDTSAQSDYALTVLGNLAARTDMDKLNQQRERIPGEPAIWFAMRCLQESGK